MLVGFAGVALLLLPGKQTGGAPILALLTLVAAAMWAGGSVASPRLPLPRHRFVSGGWQMLFGGAVCVADGGWRASPATCTSPVQHPLVLGLGYLVVFGSLLAFTAYAWLLQNAPLSKVSTYAYVNPVVAILLGWTSSTRRSRGSRWRAPPSSSPRSPPSSGRRRAARTLVECAKRLLRRS